MPRPLAWPAHAETEPEAGINTDTWLMVEPPILERFELHFMPPLIKAPPETSISYWPDVLLSDSVSVSPDVKLPPQLIASPEDVDHDMNREDAAGTWFMIFGPPTRRARLQGSMSG